MTRRFRMEWHGDRYSSLMGVGLNAGLEEAAEYLLEESNRSVPIEDLPLQRSGEVSTDTAAKKAAVSYDTPYAVRQHEHAYRHDPGRRRKFLEIPWLANRSEMRDIIGRAVRRHLHL
ncbi:hypothetical protein [Streptomyces sp.]|uniref:hypothetical protein n=1 Tax=Streptomyces sp. TaxID=1931 RepID=UPI002F9353A9